MPQFVNVGGSLINLSQVTVILRPQDEPGSLIVEFVSGPGSVGRLTVKDEEDAAVLLRAVKRFMAHPESGNVLKMRDLH